MSDEGVGTPQDPSVIDWSWAERVAGWVTGRRPPSPTYRPASMQRAFDRLTAQAEELVAEVTGLAVAAGRARARVIDRGGWVSVNVASFQRLLGPALAKLASRRAASTASLPPWVPRQLAAVSRSVSGTQMGLVLAWMSTRVLGQYDLLLTDGVDEVHQDIVYFVGPNVSALEARYEFDPAQFRLWLALHEVTHRAQFMGVPWLRSHFVSLVEAAIEPLVSDPRRMADGLRRAAQEIRAGRSPLRDAGMLGLVATEHQLAAVRRIQALMSLLEGHGEATMDRAGAEVLTDAARFGQVLRERREQARGPSRLLQELLGIEAKLRQYKEGERFVQVVEAAGGRTLFDRVWEGPEWLPSLAEIREPSAWIRRASPPSALAG